jgi:hypothetical protein
MTTLTAVVVELAEVLDLSLSDAWTIVKSQMRADADFEEAIEQAREATLQ